jgi:cyclic pyranopterin phosphate synthase
MSGEFTHLDSRGAARMVDVSGKDVTVRTATASGRVRVSFEVIALLRGDGVPKGDALAVARIAGIQAAKRTPDLVPLCHPLAIHGVEVDLQVEDDAVAIVATVRTADRTGVEMEALTCCPSPRWPSSTWSRRSIRPRSSAISDWMRRPVASAGTGCARYDPGLARAAARRPHRVASAATAGCDRVA